MLAVAGRDVDLAQAAIEDDFLSGLDEAGRAAAQSTIDLDAEENSCPACGGPLTGLPERCPSCGLRFR